MAVLSSLPGISVTVHNDQGQLPEYADAEPDIVKDLESPSSVVVSNYIEAPPRGGSFWFKFRVEAPYLHGPYRIMFRYEIQGTDDNSGKSCGPLDLENRGFWETAFKGYTGTDKRGPVFRDFWFAKLRILPGDDQSYGLSEAEKSKMDSIGTLQIRVLLGERKGNRTFDDLIVHRPTTTFATDKLAANKGLSLGISYTDTPITNAAAAPWQSTFINGWDHPIAVFQFKYRSRADLQKLLFEKSPETDQGPREGLFRALPTTLVPSPMQKPNQEQPTRLPQPVQAAQPESADLSGVTITTAPIQTIVQMRESVDNGENHLQAIPSSAKSPSPFSLGRPSRAFEELKFAEVRDLARKQYKCFDEVNGDEIEKLARQKHANGMIHADGGGGSSSSSMSHTSRVFEDLTFDEVWDLARKQHKDFNELNGHEIRKLAMQKHSEGMAASQAATSRTADGTNSQGKRKASIKFENEDEDVVFVSTTKKRK